MGQSGASPPPSRPLAGRVDARSRASGRGGCPRSEPAKVPPPRLARRRASRPSPPTAGLSPMTEHAEEEGIVPACTLDLLAHGCAAGERSDDVDGEPAQGREIFWSVVRSGAIGVLAEDDVEHPMQPILDTPVPAYNLQQFPGA